MKNKGDRYYQTLFLAVSLILLSPVLILLLSIFWQDGPTLSHITSVLGDSTWTLELARNSFSLATWTAVACMIPAVPMGFILFRTRVPGRKLIIAVLIVAAAIPMFVTSAAWTAVIGNDYWFSMDTWYEKVLIGGLVQAIAWFPWAALLSGLAFCSNDMVQEETALLDTNLVTLFFKVTIPSATKGLSAVALLLVIFSLSDITITDCIRLSTFQQECYTQFQLPDVSMENTNFEAIIPRRAAAVALPYTAFLLSALILLLPKLKRDYSRSNHGEESSIKMHRLRNPYKPILTAYCWLLPGILLGLPMFKLIVAVTDWSMLASSLKASSREISITLENVFAASELTTVIAFIWATESTRSKTMARIYGTLSLLLLVVPAPLTGISIIFSLNNDILGGFYGSPMIYSYAYILRILPFVYFFLYAELSRISPDLREESLLAGAGLWSYLSKVLGPLSWRALVASFLLGIIMGIGEVGASFLVQSPGYTTLSVRFFTMIHSGMDAGVAALCLVVIATSVLPAALFSMVLWKRFRL